MDTCSREFGQDGRLTLVYAATFLVDGNISGIMKYFRYHEFVLIGENMVGGMHIRWQDSCRDANSRAR